MFKMNSCAAAALAAATISASLAPSPTVQDIGGHCIVEQRDILRDQRHILPKRSQRHIADILPIDQYPALPDLVKTGNQV